MTTNRNIPWFIVSLCLCGSVYAQATAPAKPATPPSAATTSAKPAEPAKPAAHSDKSPADAKLDKSGAAKPAAPSPAAAAAGAAKPAAPSPAAAAAGAAKPAAPSPAAAAATMTAPNSKNVEWAVDPTHSQIGFVTKHLGFTKVNGHFNKFTASAHGDPKTAKLTTLEASADTASIDTGNEKRDKHLRGEDFFNADKFPQLKLVAKSFKWNGNKFTANVDLTIRDVTKPVTFKGELLGVHKVNFGQGEQLRAGYEASATINRKDFGLTWSMVTEGIAVVADPVQIELAAELSYTPPPTAASASTPAAPTAAK